MRSPSVAAVQVLKVTSPGSKGDPYISNSTEDTLAVEEPLEISLVYGDENNRQSRNISVTMRTPGQDEELALGFLFTEGIIKNRLDIDGTRVNGLPGSQSITIELKPGIRFDARKIERHFYTSSSCGVCGKSSIDAVRNAIPDMNEQDRVLVKASVINSLPGTLRVSQEIFASTGGLHACALFDLAGNLLLTREDVGRHNALDKLVGASLQEQRLPLNEHILLLSGRASFELIQKAAMAGIRAVCAVGAPSSLAVSLALETGITLIGFLRDGRFNIYTGPQRIEK